MTTLATPLRNQLQRSVQQARVAAEQGARQALEALAVHHHEPWGSMDTEQRQLRRRLRAHGRQLGDELDQQSGRQRLDRLIEEVAYEFWHRMLFARFLAENDLLIEAQYGVPISFEDCEELAREKGQDPWEYAAGLAQSMLPQIFRADSPAFSLKLPTEYQLQLVRLLTELPTEIFHASDALGWVYQFWQTARKDEINASGSKIGARELPAVTQLFTEPYMVSFLLDNALGAWWAARRLSEEDLKSAESEQELRDRAAIPGVPLEYLRFVRDENDAWTPAAGTFERWPDQLAELKVLDPCCGSGHFLVAVFLMLVPMRMALEGLNAREASDAVLRENLHGLELDQRCVELAAFALALTVWRYPGAGGYRPLPELQLACSGLSVSVAKEEWKQLGLGKHNLTIALDWMHDTFRDAPVLGSLINPARTDAAKIVQWEELSGALEQALQQEQGEQQQEAAVVAQGLAKAASLLAGQYHWVVTNVPYLSSAKQNQRLQKFCESNYPLSKLDLATVFLERCLEFCRQGGASCAVLPQNWLFLTSYKKFREKLLIENKWHLIARLGSQAFQTPMWDFNVQLISISRGDSAKPLGGLFARNDGSNMIRGLDVSSTRVPAGKAQRLSVDEVRCVKQENQLLNPDARITLENGKSGSLLSESSICPRGIVSGDGDRWVRQFWEVLAFDSWKFLQGTTSQSEFYSGLDKVIDWSRQGDEMLRPGRENRALNKPGVNVSLIGALPVTLYLGCFYDQTTATISPIEKNELSALFAYCMSKEYSAAVREIDQKLNVTPATLIKVPFDQERWAKIALRQYPNGLPGPFSNDPAQWIFHGHPCGSVVWDDEQKWTVNGPLRSDDSVLHVAVARLLGYRWPAELDADMELADEQREWVQRCGELLPFADEDGIVCIPPIRGEAAAADRLRELLKAAYGDDWSASTERELLAASAGNGKAPASLDQWLRESFFEQHCKLFQSRPFIWHIWDGRKDGFHALVNHHKLAGPDGQGRRTLESLTYSYLGEWIDRQRSDQQSQVEGSDARLAAALTLQGELEKILEGEPPYDIFVRWKPLHEQPLGWNPDINDGVRLNIRPFVLARDVGRKGAGILRSVVDKTWTNAKKVGVKDRGKEVESLRPTDEFPWFWSCDPEKLSDHRVDFGAPVKDAVPAGRKFDGQRWNNLHYSRAAREAARAAKGKKD